MKLPPSSSLEFDLAWQGSFALAIALYTDSLQPVRLAQTADEPPFGGFYSLQLNSYSTQLLLVRHKEAVAQLGMAVIPMLQQTNRARVAIKSNREQKSITLLLNGVVAKQWVEPEKFGGEGRTVPALPGTSFLGSLAPGEAVRGEVVDTRPIVNTFRALLGRPPLDDSGSAEPHTP